MSVSTGLKPCCLQFKTNLFFQDRHRIMRALVAEHQHFVQWFSINSSYAIFTCLLGGAHHVLKYSTEIWTQLSTLGMQQVSA